MSQKVSDHRVDSLLLLLHNSKFHVSRIAKSVDSTLTLYKGIDRRFCFANPGEIFDSTDFSELPGLCPARFVLYGVATTTPNFRLVLYEEDKGGGPGKTCDLYFVQDGKLKELISFWVYPTTKSILGIKRSVRQKRYTVIHSYSDNN